VVQVITVAGIYRLGSNILRAVGAGALWLPSGGGGGGSFNFDSGWSLGSGSMADGQTPQIQYLAGGLNLLTDMRPIVWMPGNSYTPNSTYSRSTSARTAQTNASIDTGTKPTNGVGSFKQTFPTGGSSPANWWAEDPAFTFSNNTVLVSCKRLKNWTPLVSPNDNNDKTFRVWPAAFGLPDVYHKNAQGGSSITVEGYSNADDAMSPPGNHFFTVNHTPNVWIQDEHLFRDSTVNLFDGVNRWYRNGARAHPESVGWNTRTSSGEPGSAGKSLVYLDQYSNQATSGDMVGHGYEDYVCDLYINDSFGSFYISSESTFTQVTMNGSNDPGVIREYQLPTASSGSDTGCTILIRKGLYSSLSGLYLWFRPMDGSNPVRVGGFT